MSNSKKQYNVTLDETIIRKVKLIAITLQVPQYAVVEYLLRVGSNHVLKALDDPEQRKDLVDYLENIR